ncbi:MAG TPA: hypothetical protein VGR15_04205 [Bacteroidota bacterium]|nr:hypothetical protein [Bacteroidota bacterium]
MNYRWPLRILKVIVIVTAAAFSLGFVTMQLWNSIVPDVFHGPAVSFWQAVGLLLLSHILLRGWGPWRFGNGWRRDRWRHRFEEKLATMTPEDREKFKLEWRRRCGWESGEQEGKKEAI